MIVSITWRIRSPARKLCALFEGAVTVAKKLGLGYADLFQRRSQGRPSSLANTNRTDVW